MSLQKRYRFDATQRLVREALKGGWTQADIARACRTQQSVVSAWANGRGKAYRHQIEPLLEQFGHLLGRAVEEVYLVERWRTRDEEPFFADLKAWEEANPAPDPPRNRGREIDDDRDLFLPSDGAVEHQRQKAENRRKKAEMYDLYREEYGVWEAKRDAWLSRRLPETDWFGDGSLDYWGDKWDERLPETGVLRVPGPRVFRSSGRDLRLSIHLDHGRLHLVVDLPRVDALGKPQDQTTERSGVWTATAWTFDSASALLDWFNQSELRRHHHLRGCLLVALARNGVPVPNSQRLTYAAAPPESTSQPKGAEAKGD